MQRPLSNRQRWVDSMREAWQAGSDGSEESEQCAPVDAPCIAVVVAGVRAVERGEVEVLVLGDEEVGYEDGLDREG